MVTVLPHGGVHPPASGAPQPQTLSKAMEREERRGEVKDNLLGHGLLLFSLEVLSSSQEEKAF